MTSAEIIEQGEIKDEDQYALMLDHLLTLICLGEEGQEVDDQIKKVSDILEAFENINYVFGKPTQEEIQAFFVDQGIEYEEVSAS